MAVTYRMTGTNFDVLIDTDASRRGREFFITDVRGLNATEIQAGFDIGLVQYNESQLVAFANQAGYNLSSFDEQTEERTVLLQASSAPFGRFNGVSSNLATPELQVTSSNEFITPLVISCQIYISSVEVQTMLTNNRRYHLYSTNQDAGDNFDLYLQVNGTNDFTLGANNTLGSGSTSTGGGTYDLTARLTSIADRLLTVTTRLNDTASSDDAVPLDFTVEVNNEVFIYQAIPKTVVSNLNRFIFSFGALNSSNVLSAYFLGLMRNVVVTAGATNLLTVANPSTGTNTGTAGNATPTGISNVTVIR